jgi:uncharacterized protein YodC (DUF2158 family)
MTENFNVGDIVRLKSGSPKMTIQKIDEYNFDKFYSAICQWFDGDKSKEGTFPLHSIEKVEP